ncbi:MAG: hypothetical protein JJE50_09805 [Actinomycetales bacterium]|nr:hypothetical protein [Actinomycetales bacterium]
MAIVVGFIPEGNAALLRAALKARVRQTSLVVVASHDPAQEKSKDALARFEAELEQVAARLAEDGLTHEVRRFDRGPAAE